MEERLTHKEMFERWYQKHAKGKIRKDDARKVFRAVFEEIVDVVREDKRVVIDKFGAFYPFMFQRSGYKSYLIDDVDSEVNKKILKFSKSKALYL